MPFPRAEREEYNGKAHGMRKLRVLLTFGTRPEAVKMAPLVHECRRHDDRIETIVCVTGQHREMLDQVTDYFGIEVDRDLDLMTPNQTLADVTARCLTGLDAALAEYRPDCLAVQGDTTTVMAAALAAFYRRVPLVHVEAGLRTGNLQAPWPEELNRRIASLVTTLHCAPTNQAAENLRQEGISPDAIHVTGNTVIDALLWTVAREREQGRPWREKYAALGDRRMVLITGHRRENFGDGMKHICSAILILAQRFPEVEFLYPVHLNPNVREPVGRLLSGQAEHPPLRAGALSRVRLADGSLDADFDRFRRGAGRSPVAAKAGAGDVRDDGAARGRRGRRRGTGRDRRVSDRRSRQAGC